MHIRRTMLAKSGLTLGLFGRPVPSRAHDRARSYRSARDCRRSSDFIERVGRGPLENHLIQNADHLILNKELRDALNAIEAKYRPELKDLQQLLSDNQKALARMGATDVRLQGLAEAQGRAIADLIVLRKRMRADVDRVLIEDQHNLHELLEHG